MKNRVLCLTFLSLSFPAMAAPPLQEELELRTTIDLAADVPIAANSMYNPRLFDGKTYVTQLNTPGFGRYPAKSPVFEVAVTSEFEHRMIAPFRGANSTNYMIASSGASSVFSRYDLNGENRLDVPVPGAAQTVEGFDWVDEDTIIYTNYASGTRKRLSLATVVADPFEVTPDTQWNANGYVETGVSSRIRNVRVGQTFTGFAYYGDAGQNNSPNFYAINLATGAETLLGNAGTLTSATNSFGLWTVTERGGYLYVQTTDNGIQVYNMTGGAGLGALHTTYTKSGLDALTGYTGQYYGFDVSPDGKQLVLGAANGKVFELAMIPPVRLTATFNVATDAGVGASSIFNPRIFDGDAYVNQININTFGFGRYALGAADPVLPEMVLASSSEHRMVAPFRGANKEAYLLGASGATTPVFTRYDYDGQNREDVPVPGEGSYSEGFDWADENTIIYTNYNPSENRKRLSLARVTANPFAVTADTRWNANGYITTSVTSRIRNVRTGDVYSGFAYYGDNGQNTSPKFYAVNLATGAETLLGNLDTLTGGGSFGLWTVTERGGRLYVQTTDNGISVYKMNSATSLGALETVYSKADLDEATGGSAQYYGFDGSQDGKTFLLGGGGGKAWQLTVTANLSAEQVLSLDIRRSGSDIILTWPATITGGVIQAAEKSSPLTFTTLNPQPAVTVADGLNIMTIPQTTPARFFRLAK